MSERSKRLSAVQVVQDGAMPMNPDAARSELAAARTALSTASGVLDDAANAIATATEEVRIADTRVVAALAQLEGEEPPPPGPWPMPQLEVEPGDGQLKVTVRHPVDTEPADCLVLAWGRGGAFIGSAIVQPPFGDTTLHTITRLANGVEHTVQAGYGEGTAAVPAEHLVTARATPQGTTGPPPTGDYPRGSSIEDRVRWIVQRAGLPSGQQLQLAGPGNVPPGCQWAGSGQWPSLYVWDATLLEGWDIPARIVPRGLSGPDITLRRCRFYDAFTWEQGRIRTVEQCHSTGPPAGVVAAQGWGQANLNALRAGWVCRASILEGMADNVQQSGGGVIEDSILRRLVIFGPAGSGSHNDHVQNYGGLITLRRTLVEQTVTAAQDSHVNSVFCDGGDIDLIDSLVLITAPQGSNTWALHAAKGSNRIRVEHSSVRGKVVGNIVQGPGADIVATY